MAFLFKLLQRCTEPWTWNVLQCLDCRCPPAFPASHTSHAVVPQEAVWWAWPQFWRCSWKSRLPLPFSRSRPMLIWHFTLQVWQLMLFPLSLVFRLWRLLSYKCLLLSKSVMLNFFAPAVTLRIHISYLYSGYSLPVSPLCFLLSCVFYFHFP